MVPRRVTRVDQEQTDVLANLLKVGYERDRSVVVSGVMRSLICR